MSLNERLQAVLASYGADPANWPAAEREALLPLLDRAGLDLAAAREIDQLLDRATIPEIAPGFEGRLLARAASNVVPFARPALRWTMALPLAASLALGIYLGAAGFGFSDEDGDDLSGVSAAMDYSGEQTS